MTTWLQAAAVLAVLVWLTLWSAMQVAPLLGWSWEAVIGALWLALLVVGAVRGRKP